MPDPYFHKCPEAEEHVGVFILRSFLNRIPNIDDYHKCTKRLTANDQTAYWFRYDNATLGLVKIKMISEHPLILAVMFTPMANLN